MKVVSRGVAVSLVIFCAVFGCIAQEKLRRIEQPTKFVYPNTPLEVAFTFDGKHLPNREVQAGPDWLRRISLEVTNVSGKDIDSVWINVMLREPKYGVTNPKLEDGGIVITVELTFSEPTIKILPAGDRVTLKLPARIVDLWTEFARKQGMDDIEKVILDIRRVRFTDDTGWDQGYRTRKDPESGKYLFVQER